MPLLKEINAELVAHHAIVLDLGDLRRQADQLKQRAVAEADQILADARRRADEMTGSAEKIGHDAGYQKGSAEGLEKGRADGHAEALQQTAAQLQQLQEAWVNATRQWDAERRQMILDVNQSLLELAVAVARKVVKRVPQVDPTVVKDQIAAAVEQMARPADVTIRVHPQDRPLVNEALPQFTQAMTELQHVLLVDDESIQRGGCVVTYANAQIDATLDTQLDRIVELLLPQQGSAPTPAPTPTPKTSDKQDTEPAA